jgi:PAS domain-containing protein
VKKGRNLNLVEFEKFILAKLFHLINLSPDEIRGEVYRVLGAIGEFSQADRAYLVLFDQGKMIEKADEWCAAMIGPQVEDLKGLLWGNFSWKWENLLRLEIVNIPRVADLPREASIEKRLLQALDIQSLLWIPLGLEGVCAGLLGVESVRSERTWDGDKTALFKGVGEAFINILSHKRADAMFKNLLQQIERIKKEWESTADSLSELVFLIDKKGHIIRANRVVERWGVGSVANIRGRKIHDILHPGCVDPACIFETYLPLVWEKLAQDRTIRWEFADRVLKRYLSVKFRPISAIIEEEKKISFTVVVINDITNFKRKEKEREKLVHELQNSLSSTRILRGLLSICASCKKIRDNKGSWNQIEAYIRDHSEAEFSHGICPECMKKLYGNIADEEDK